MAVRLITQKLYTQTAIPLMISLAQMSKLPIKGI